MRARIVHDGRERLEAGKEFQQRRKALREAIRAKYAAELASPKLFVRWRAGYRASVEFDREWAKVRPSAGSLFARAG